MTKGVPSFEKLRAMSLDDLGAEYVYWFRVARNENGLKGDEKKTFQRLVQVWEESTKKKPRQIRDR